MGDWHGAVEDVADGQRVLRSKQRFEGQVWSIRTDEVELRDGQIVVRDVVEHPGAVGVIALDEDERVLVVRQYRHPVGGYLWEAPAGLLDVEGEDPLAAAQRELHEEAGLRASSWQVLVDFFNSPGGSDEMFRCFLARGLRAVDEADRHLGDGEERDMPITWLPLEEAVGRVLRGKLHNPTTVAGVLATYAARARGWTDLRAADAPWPERDRHRKLT